METNAAIKLPSGSQGKLDVNIINGVHYAKKTYRNTNTNTAKVLRKREYNALVALKDCPHIVNVHKNRTSNTENSTPNTTIIHTQYGEGGDLFSYIDDIITQLLSKQLPKNPIKTIGEGKMKEIQIDKSVIPLEIQNDVMMSIDKIYNILFQLLTALHCMHKSDYYHLDLKPENIVFTDKEKQNIAIIDFGFAHHNTNKTNICTVARGTLLYSSPLKRSLMTIKKEMSYSCQKDDIYALGQIMKDLCELLRSSPKNENKELYDELAFFIFGTMFLNEGGRWGWMNIKEWFNKLSKLSGYKTLVNNKLNKETYDECYRQLNLSKGGSQKAKRKTRKYSLRC